MSSGYIGLAAWTSSRTEGDIRKQNKEARERLRKAINDMNPYMFEKLVAVLLAEMGCRDVDVTPAGRDGGVDVRETMVIGEVIQVPLAVQVKNHGANVGSPDIQKLRGSLTAHEEGLVVSASGFSPGARTEAKKTDRQRISLMDGDTVIDLMIQYGVAIKKHEVIEVVEDISKALSDKE